jgi:hypothetical protein
VVGARAERLPARRIDSGRRRLPWRLGGNGEDGAGLDNTRHREVHWGLVKLVEWLAGGERERGRELKAAAGELGGAWRGGGRCLNRPAWGPWVTTKMPPWYPSSVAVCTAATPPSDRRSVAG